MQMSSTIALPVWFVVLAGLLAAIGLLDRLLMPGVHAQPIKIFVCCQTCPNRSGLIKTMSLFFLDPATISPTVHAKHGSAMTPPDASVYMGSKGARDAST